MAEFMRIALCQKLVTASVYKNRYYNVIAIDKIVAVIHLAVTNRCSNYSSLLTLTKASYWNYLTLMKKDYSCGEQIMIMKLDGDS